MEALCAFLLIACYFDCRYRRIPNWLLGVIFTFGFARSFLLQGWRGSCVLVLCSLLLIVLLYPLFKLGMLGAGDVKLFGVCSGYFPFDKVIYFFFFSMLAAAIISVSKLMIEQNFRERFAYLGEYFLDVLRGGQWQLYVDNQKGCSEGMIPLAGAVLAGVLMYMGGVY